jgi:hypothetical protein
MILFDINKPSPVPTKDFEANFEKSLGMISGSIPIPVSFMETITLLSLLSLLSFISDEITMLPFCVNLIAFGYKRNLYVFYFSD